MSNKLNPTTAPSQPMVYQIRIEGHLGCQWTDWFGGLTITLEDDGDTLLTGPLNDQAALHGLLKKVRDLGMPLVSVSQVQFNETHPYRSKKGEKMNTNKKIARIVGALFITAAVTGILSAVLLPPILGDPAYLTKLIENKNQVIMGSLFGVIMAVACAGIAIGLYPVLRKHNEGLALGSVGFRIIEAVFWGVNAIIPLSLLTLSQEYVKAGALDASNFQILGTLLLSVRDSAGPLLGAIAFSLGAFMYYYIFYQSKLIPRWLSGWGLIAIILHLAVALLTMFALIDPFSTIGIVMNLPIALQEMVLAVWLIVKGFNPSAIASLSAKTATNELLSAS